MTDTKTIVTEKLSKLPFSLQEAVLSDEFAETLRALAKKYKLHFDKWGILEDEIMLTLVNEKTPKDLEYTIKHKIGLNDEQTQELMQDIAENVFAPVRELLKQALEKVKKKQEEAQDPRAPKMNQEDKRRGLNLDQAFNLGEIEEIDDPYLEKIEL